MFRKQVVALFLTAFVTLGVVNTVSSNINKTVSFSRNDLTFSSQRGYDVVDLRSALRMTDLGKPMMPMRRLYFIIPESVSVANCIVLPTDSISLPGNFQIYPAQPPVKAGGDSLPPFIPPDSMTYNSPTPFPVKTVEIGADGYSKEAHLLIVDVYPLKWVPTTHRLTIYTKLTLSLDFKPSLRGPLGAKRRGWKSQADFETYLHHFVANPEDIGTYLKKPPEIEKVGKPVGKYVITSLPSVEGNMVEYVIITSRACSSAFGPLAEWKTQKGVPAVIKTTEWISATYHGCDLSEKIRNFVKDAYTYWGTDWVLLGGDMEIVPCRYVEQPQTPISDLYYSDLQGNWDKNGDGMFGFIDYSGAWDFDDPLVYWDVVVGRIPAHSANDVGTFWSKLNSYERIDPGMTDYVKKALFLGAYANGSCYGPESKDDYIGPVIPQNWTIYKLYADAFHCLDHPGNEYLRRGNVISQLTNGYHFVNHIDHGSPYFLQTQWDGLTRSDINTIVSPWKSAIFYSLGCWLAAIDYDCIAERFILNPNGGAVAFVGNTRDGTFDEGSTIDWGFFSAIFDSSVFHLGQAVEHARRHEFRYSYYKFFELILLGDPEMPIWTSNGNPRTLVVQHPTQITMGEQYLVVTVLDDVNPVEGALVCLEKRNTDNKIEAYAYNLTNASGQVGFSYTPETSGDLIITVTAHNYIPHESVCQVQKQIFTPYVYPVKGSSIYLDSPGGNGDGQPNPGESMGLTLGLQNSGDALAGNVHAEISINPPKPSVTVTKSGADFGSIQSGETVRNTGDPFGISVSSQCQDLYKCTIDININDNMSHIWHDRFYLEVLGDSLKFVGHSRINTDLGQHSLTDLAITNTRSGSAAGVVATLESTDPNKVIIIDGTSAFGQINANSSVVSTDPFTYQVLDNPFSFILHMTDAYGREWIKNFEGVILSPPFVIPPLTSTQTTIGMRWLPVTNAIGYHIYRSTNQGGPYTRINTSLVEGTSTYLDTGLNPNTTYFYRVTAVDNSLNEGDYSDEVNATTNYYYVEGWPKQISGEGVTWSSPVVGRISSPGRQLVIGGGDGKVYAWRSNGNLVNGWPKDLGLPVNTTSALGDLNSDGFDEVVVATRSPLGGTDIYIWDGSGNPFPNWNPKRLSDDSLDGGATPTLVDLDGNGQLDILLGTIYLGSQGRVNAWQLNGNPTPGWNVPITGTKVQGLAVGNVCGDWHVEIFASTPLKIYGWDNTGAILSGWGDKISQAAVCALVSLGDIDRCGNMEVIGVLWPTANGDKYMYAWDGSGNIKWYKAFSGDGLMMNSTSLGDIRSTGFLDIFFCPSWEGKLRARDYLGNLLYIFSKDVGGLIYGCPLVGRFMGQGNGDVLFGQSNNVYGFNSSGDLLQGWPLKENGTCQITPCVADFDGNGQTKLVSATQDGWVYVWNLGTAYDKEHQEWPMFLHDKWHTGCYTQTVSKTLPGNTIWRGNIELTGDVTVPAGVTLTIEPGTVIKVRKVPELQFKLIVQGTLSAVGTALDSIYFTSGAVSPAPNDWYGIDVLSGGSANLQYCSIRYGYNNLTAESGSNNVTISHCRITNGAAAGILLRKPASNYSQTVNSCYIADNALYGINVWGPWGTSVSSTIVGNTISNNGNYGVFAHYNINSGGIGSLLIKSNTISFPVGLPNPSFYGIACDTVTNVGTVEANYIEGYGQGGIRMYRSSPKCTCNVVSNCATNGLYFFNGTSIVTHNTVDGVSTGAYVTSTSPALKPNLGNVGNAAQNDNGKNNINGNTWDGNNVTAGQVKAENNWWGGGAPVVSGNWDTDPTYPGGPPPSCGGGGGPQMGELLEQQLPRVFALAQSRPNPTTGDLVIHYQMPKASDVSMNVYNVSGQLVKTLVKGPQKAGYYAVSWNGRDEFGHAVRSGVYFYRMDAGDFRAIRKLVIVR